MTAGAYLCPRCRASALRDTHGYRCSGCGADYPILCGIPDFRLAPDRYLSLEDERAKAARLHEFARSHSFAETLAEYYRITDDVSPAMARRYADYVIAGEARGRAVLRELAPARRLLDAGCGAGGLVVAAARAGLAITGTDIALRWLVIAAKRLEEEGLDADLVCADIGRPPFPDASFDRIAATDLFEHVPDLPQTANALFGLLEPGGALYGTGANRSTLAVYPPAGLWGVGFLPKVLRRRYVTARRGIDTLRFLSMQTPGSIARALQAAGFTAVKTAPMSVPAERAAAATGGAKRALFGIYRLLREVPVARAGLLRLGPVFEISAQRPAGSPRSERTGQ
jgi:2-polyprenyl-3-methyl-5-hydroxy-6-metoxy-1,4-benzoquinol methylase